MEQMGTDFEDGSSTLALLPSVLVVKSGVELFKIFNHG